MSFEIYTTKEFDKELTEIDKGEAEHLKKEFFKLKENPESGERLKHDFFREKRINEKRAYYLVYHDLGIILFVGVSGKKNQEKTIQNLEKRFKEFREYAESMIK